MDPIAAGAGELADSSFFFHPTSSLCDPPSIAATAGGLADSSLRLAMALYAWTQETGNVDKNLSGLYEEMIALSSVLGAIRKAYLTVRWTFIAMVDSLRRFNIAAKAALDNIKATLDSMNQRQAKLGEVQKTGGIFGRGFLGKPMKQVRLGMRLRDITAYKGRINSYITAMNGVLHPMNL